MRLSQSEGEAAYQAAVAGIQQKNRRKPGKTQLSNSSATLKPLKFRVVAAIYRRRKKVKEEDEE